MLKRIGGWVVVVIATLIFVLLLGSILGVWVGQRAFARGADSLLASVEDYLGLAISGLNDVGVSLDTAKTRVDEITTRASEISAEGGSPVGLALKKTVADDVVPVITRVRSLVANIFKAMTGFNATLVAVNRMPGVEVPTFTSELDTVGTKLQNIGAEVDGLEQSIAEADGTRVISATTRISTDIGEVQTKLEESTQMVVNVQVGMGTLRLRLPWYLRLGALATTFLLAFLTWGQWLLIGKSWQWARGR